MVVFAIAIFFVIKPQYQSTTQMIVSQKVSKNIQDTQLQGLQQADSQLVNTYKGIITSPTVSNRVQKKLGNNKLVKRARSVLILSRIHRSLTLVLNPLVQL
ncbi:MAG: Hypothetical protein AJITA_00034 [Acetilactobacillus jinshanensis]